MSDSKPRGSGLFAIVCGVLFLLALVPSVFAEIREALPETIMRAWLAFVALILIGWGTRRLATAHGDWTVGQDTINFVVAIVGATLALLGMLKLR